MLFPSFSMQLHWILLIPPSPFSVKYVTNRFCSQNNIAMGGNGGGKETKMSETEKNSSISNSTLFAHDCIIYRCNDRSLGVHFQKGYEYEIHNLRKPSRNTGFPGKMMQSLLHVLGNKSRFLIFWRSFKFNPSLVFLGSNNSKKYPEFHYGRQESITNRAWSTDCQVRTCNSLLIL